MLDELRTSALSPKLYYELYVVIVDELRFLESYLYDEQSKNDRKVAELYELVQYAGNIVPRLYLLITVGSVYIKSKEAPAKEVLRDLVEMTKGIQHPTRGLFLRSYLSEMTKDKLPDEGSEYSGVKGGNVRDCIDFIVQNFTDMNKLWVRLQHQGSIRDRAKREQERKELGPLIGKQLSRLSNLEGLTATLYASHVLPALVEQITSCKDAIAQEYLMECTVQVFPDEFHLLTLETILETAAGLVEGVDVKSIVVNLTDRLVSFVKSNRERVNPSKVDMFETFFGAISRITQERKSMPAEDMLSLYKSLMDLTIQVYPKSLQNVDKIFSVAGPVLAAKKEEQGGNRNTRVVKGVMALLRSPLENYHNVLTVLALESYPLLFDFLTLADRRRACLEVVKAVIDDGVLVPTPEHVDALLRLVSPLLIEQEGENSPEGDEGDEDDDDFDPQAFAEEQNLVGSLVHLFKSRAAATDLVILVTVRKYFGMGGKRRIRHSVPPLVFRAIEVARQLHSETDAAEWEASGARVYKFLLGTTKTFVELVKQPELSFRMLLQCAQSASATGFQAVAYQFMEKAYTIYEEDITDSVAGFNAMSLLIPTLATLRLAEDDQMTLLAKTAQHASRVLKKGDQCTLVALVSHLFHDSTRVMECMARSVRIASGMAESITSLFAMILSHYLYYFANGNEHVTVEFLNTILELVANKSAEDESGQVVAFYSNSLKYLERMKRENPDKYGGVKQG